MVLRFIIVTLILTSRFAKINAQNFPENNKTPSAKTQEENLDYAVLEFMIKNNQNKTPITAFFIQLDGTGVFLYNEKGHSKFFVKKGRYRILIKAVGYKDKVISNRKFQPNKTYNIDVALDEKKESMD